MYLHYLLLSQLQLELVVLLVLQTQTHKVELEEHHLLVLTVLQLVELEVSGQIHKHNKTQEMVELVLMEI